MRYGLVEQRRRAAARVALYGSLMVVGLATAGTFHLLSAPMTRATETSWGTVDWQTEPSVRVLQQLVRIDSNTETGDEYAAALFLSTALEAAGIPVHVERLGDRHANLWAILEGEERDALVLHSHLDVEPVKRQEAWVHPPFAGTIYGPWIFGRGTFDMKSYTVAQVMALLRLKAANPRPRRSVILLATSGEERGSDLGMRWILREHPELVERFWAVLTEGGVVEARNLESLKYWGTEVGQKRFLHLIACAPTRERLEELRTDILTIGFQPTDLRIDPEIRRWWALYSDSRDRPDLREMLADPDRLQRDPALFLELPAYLRSMLRDELVPFRPTPAPGGGWEMRMMLHLLPGADARRARAELLPPWLLAGVDVVERQVPPPARISPVDHPVMAAIQAQLRADLRVPHSGPFFLPFTATDSRFLRPRGIPSYGFTPFFIFTTDTLHVDNANERIAVEGFGRGVDLYSGLLARIAG